MKRPLIVPALLLALLAIACEPENASRGRVANPDSAAITLNADGTELLIAAEDHDQLLLIDRDNLQVERRIDVGDGPFHALALGDALAVVSNRYGHSLSVVDTGTGTVVKTITVGVEPLGMSRIDEKTVAVALGGESGLAIVDIDAGEVTRKIDLGAKDPRAVARLKDGTLMVSHMGAGVMSRVNITSGEVRTVDAATFNTKGPQTHPNHLRSLTVAPDGESVLVAHSQSNASTVRAPIGEPVDGELGPDGSMEGACGYSGCPAELGAVVPAVTEIDIGSNAVVVPVEAGTSTQGNMDGDRGMAAPDCFDCGFGFMTPNPPSFLNPFENRFFGVNINNPSAIALFADGNAQIVVNMGSKNALLLRRPLTGLSSDVIGAYEVGNGASAVAVSADGKDAYVWNQFDASVTHIALPDLSAEIDTPSSFFETSDAKDRAPEFAEVVVEPTSSTVLVEDALTAEASLGRKLFHDATNTAVSQNATISCASCHPDGRTDGQTWQFSFGPRNTPQLGGGILDTAPFHWPGDVETVRSLNEMTVLRFMGGNGVSAGDMDAIGAFLDTIRAAPAPNALAGDYTESERRGLQIFYSDAAGCSSCHAGQHFTDNQNWDVKTRASEVDIEAFQTPVLHGLDRSGPYLHDGSALTLRDLVHDVVATDRMGHGSHLTDSELEDLIAYLRTL